MPLSEEIQKNTLLALGFTGAIVVATIIFYFIILLLANVAGLRVNVNAVTIEGFDGHDYGGKQRRDVMRSDIGASGLSLADKIREAIALHEATAAAKAVAAPAVTEGLVGSAGEAPAFWEGGRYNLEGKMKGGAIDIPGNEGFRRDRLTDAELSEGFRRDRLNDEELLG